MIFMGERRPEQRHDAVAHDLVHRALVAVHGLHHAFEDGVEDSPGFFRVAVGQELHGPLQVSKEDRDLLALALQGALGCEDLLGEMLGGVGLGGGETAGLTGERRPARTAELLARRDGRATTRTGRLKPGATVLAKARARVILNLAPGTLHAVTLWRAGPGKVG